MVGRGERSGSQISFGSKTFEFSFYEYAENFSATVEYDVSNINGLHVKGVRYEDYNMEAVIKINYKDGTETSEKVRFRIETNFKKERRNTSVDFIISV